MNDQKSLGEQEERQEQSRLLNLGRTGLRGDQRRREGKPRK